MITRRLVPPPEIVKQATEQYKSQIHVMGGAGNR